jgi:hypothetical protein
MTIMTAATTLITIVTATTIATLWNRALCENVIVAQLVRKFPEIYGTQRYIFMFTRACHVPVLH